jgi:hypothetical protein
VVELFLSRQAATVVANGEELTQWIHRCLTDQEYVATLGHGARQLVAQQQGATIRTLRLLAPLLIHNAAPNQKTQQAA